ncbi:MAG: hypothetical protein IPN89_18165 [Saprospiraceae bacterium]|nr:hypothetical protein [Saprospiraceae bacterium]
MQSRLILLFAFFCFAAISCHKDSESNNEEIITNTFTAKVYQEVSSTIIGYIYDENNQPVTDATVAIYSTTVKSNQHGVFEFKNVKMDQQGTYIKVIKNGYVLGSDYVYPTTNATSYSYVKMIKLKNDKSFDSASSGTIAITGGGKVIFAAGTIAKADGSPYTGKVMATAQYLNPNDREIGNVMPGGLIADATNGNTVVLGTLGMVAIELRDETGNELNLRSGAKATIEFPVNTSTKPAEIGLWSFDENKGWWKEEGKAVLSGDKYIAEVSHFSFWNCDAPFPLVEVCGKVVYTDGTPAANIGIKVEAEGIGVSYGITNSNGEFCGKMPKGKKLTFMISHYNCSGAVFTTMAGPFDQNTVLDIMTINTIPSFSVQGVVQCNGVAVTDGIVVIKVKESTLVYKAKEDGSFEIDLTQFVCGESVPVTIFGFNNTSSETSSIQTLTSPGSENVVLNVCGSACNMAGAISFNCSDKITIAVTNGSGNYSYKWDNNTTGAVLTLSNQDSIFENKTYCVTVTDIGANCEKVFCKKIGGKVNVGIESNCQNGEFTAYPYGGVEPYTFVWTTGSTGREMTATVAGTYCVTVTDINGCTGTNCNTWTGLKFIDPNPVSCTNNTYQFNSSQFTQGYIIGNTAGTTLPLTFPISINIFQTNFNFAINAFDVNCSFTQEIKLPQLIQGLTTSATNTSCGTCTDGKINVTVSTTATCFQCMTGAVKIFNVNDLNTDLSSANTAGMMAKGDYYVVVTDATTGCYIAYNKVKIQ